MSTPPAPLGAIAHYTLLERLEPSGPGELFRARDTRLGRTVTVRLFPAAFPGDGPARAALLARAQATRALSHPAIATLFDSGEHDGRVFLVFEYLKGQSLRAAMAGRAMNVRRAVELATQVADGVSDVHAAGFVHGGLSPDTITITAKGFAKSPAVELAARGGFDEEAGGGRLHDYDSPEEARGQAADDRSDIYSVGAVLYEMLTTKRPSHKGAAAPSASNAHVPKELDQVVLKAAAPNPDLRYQSAATLAAELRSVSAILEVRGGPAGEDQEETGPQTSGVRIVVMALIVLIAVAAVVWYFTR